MMLKTTIVKMIRKLAGWPDPDAACDACNGGPFESPEGADPDRRAGPDGSGRNAELPGTGHRTTAPPPRNAAVSVRPAEPSDLAAARRLLTASSLPTQGLEAQFGKQYAVAVAAASGEPVGVAGYEIHGRYGLFRSAAVDPAWRGRGIGADLTRDRIAAAEARGLDALYALTTSAADYFRRFGFRRIDRDAVPPAVRASSEFDEVCPSTAAVLRLDLGTGALIPGPGSDTLEKR